MRSRFSSDYVRALCCVLYGLRTEFVSSISGVVNH